MKRAFEQCATDWIICVDFARKINEFLQIEIKKIPNDVEVQKDVDNLNTAISQWKHLKA